MWDMYAFNRSSNDMIFIIVNGDRDGEYTACVRLSVQRMRVLIC